MEPFRTARECVSTSQDVQLMVALPGQESICIAFSLPLASCLPEGSPKLCRLVEVLLLLLSLPRLLIDQPSEHLLG